MAAEPRSGLCPGCGLPVRWDEEAQDWRHGETSACPLALPARREVLVALRVRLPSGEERSAAEVAEALLGALEVGSDNDSVRGLAPSLLMAGELA